jgi:putative flippase GtrA
LSGGSKSLCNLHPHNHTSESNRDSDGDVDVDVDIDCATLAHTLATACAQDKTKRMSLIAKQAGKYLVGAFIALALDFCTVWLLLRAGAHPFAARAVALLIGVTTTYVFNRRYTFSPDQPASLKDWFKYVSLQSVGTAMNYLIGAGLLLLGNGSTLHVAGAIFVGAVVGFSCNFFAARRVLHGNKSAPR